MKHATKIRLAAVAAIVAIGGIALAWFGRRDAHESSRSATAVESEFRSSRDQSPVGAEPAVESPAAARNASAQSPSPVAPDAPVTRAEDAVARDFAGLPGERLPVGNLAVEFTTLAAKAGNGDLQAARALFDGIRNCRDAPRTSEQLTHKLEISAGDTVELHEAARAMLRAQYVHCGGLSDAHIASWEAWGKQLAEAGDSMAQLTYQNVVDLDPGKPDYQARLDDARVRALGYLEAQLRQGNPLALQGLQAYYSANRLVGRDPYRSYVYGWAFVLSQGNRLPQGHVAFLALANAEAQLSESQRANARSEGSSLYKDCCGG